MKFDTILAIITQNNRPINTISMLFIILLAIHPAVCITVAAALPNVHATTYYPWAMIGHDSAHTGYENGTPAPRSYVSAWNATLSGIAFFSDSVVSNGVLYIGTADGNVYAINATTGAKIWNASFPTAFWTTPAVAENKVFIAGVNGMVYALNASTGVKIWNYTTAGPIGFSSPTVAEDKVFICSGDKCIYVLDINTGVKAWSKNMSYEIYTTPAVSDGKVYFATNYGRIYCYSSSNGAYQWVSTINISDPNSLVTTSPVVAGDKVFIGSYYYNKTYALNKDTDAKIWGYDTGAR